MPVLHALHYLACTACCLYCLYCPALHLPVPLLQVESCSCSAVKGCPSCVQHLRCKNYNSVLNKRAAALVLTHLLEAERAVGGGAVKHQYYEQLGGVMPQLAIHSGSQHSGRGT